MDTKIRIYGLDNNLLATLEGHSKGVISFSCTREHQLISGGWDGLAILWDLATFQQIRSFGPHENGVHVLGLSNGFIATTSTGESVNSKPDNFYLRIWNPTSGQLVGNPIKDHHGSMRAIASLPGFDGFITSANDGSIIVRSIEGQVLETLMHPLQDDGIPPFILDW
jgi:WD40 repeat protein